MPSMKLFFVVAAGLTHTVAAAPQALVYRGPAACGGCPEAIGHLLRTSPSKFNVTYVGPKEDVKLNRQSLSTADLYAQPGGGGVSRTWPYMKPHYDEVREFVANGGVYFGSCLGAYFAGTPGFNFLPHGYNTNEECTQPGAQVTNRSNTMIQANWRFSYGDKAGQLEKNKWFFFQDGAVVALPENIPNATIVARYSANDNLAALVMPYGKGRIGIQGPHTEATLGWYTPYHLHNPDGINFTYGWDMVESTFHGPAIGAAAVSSHAKSMPKSTSKSKQPSSSKSSATAASIRDLDSAVLSLLCMVLFCWMFPV